MGRDKMKSASLRSFHEEHTEPLPPVPAAGARTSFESLVREMLDQLGEDPSREGLRQTPARVETSLKWLTRGYHMSVADVIGDALYSERHENLVCVRDIEIYSLCEHHLLPFFGRAHVAYLPNGRLVGLSKIPRVIEVFARRLQVQERLTDQVADAVMEVLDPRGVGVVIEAYHLCMMMRGVEKQNSKTVTSAPRSALVTVLEFCFRTRRRGTSSSDSCTAAGDWSERRPARGEARPGHRCVPRDWARCGGGAARGRGARRARGAQSAGGHRRSPDRRVVRPGRRVGRGTRHHTGPG